MTDAPFPFDDDREYLPPAVSQARAAVLEAVRTLMHADPDGWPEHLAQVAGVACGLNGWSLDRLAEGITQVAGVAHRLEIERREDTDPPGLSMN